MNKVVKSCFIVYIVESKYFSFEMGNITAEGKTMKILLNKCRHEKGITLEKLAGLTGISKSTLNNFENGRTIPNMVQMEKIAAALNVRIGDLYDSELK